MARCRESERLRVDGSGPQQKITDRFGKVLANWYYRQNDKNVGPLSPWAMRMALRAGEIGPETLVHMEGGEREQQAEYCDSLFGDEDWEAYRVNLVHEHHQSTWEPEHLH